MGFSIKSIAAATAFAVSAGATNAAPPKPVQGPVEINELNGCIARELQKIPGEFEAARTVVVGSSTDMFSVESRVGKNRLQNMLMVAVSQEGSKNNIMFMSQIAGAINLTVAGNTPDISKPVEYIHMTGNNGPIANAAENVLKTVESNIRACMKPVAP